LPKSSNHNLITNKKILMKQRFLLMLGLVLGSVMSYAQPGGFQRRTVEERVAIIHAKLDSAFKLEAAKATQVDSVFATYYRASDKAREELMSSGERPSREAVMEKMQPLSEARDEKLKKILEEKQYEIWKKEIEPSMRPQRPGGGGGGSR
jgi:hypothetical protein